MLRFRVMTVVITLGLVAACAPAAPAPSATPTLDQEAATATQHTINVATMDAAMTKQASVPTLSIATASPTDYQRLPQLPTAGESPIPDGARTRLGIGSIESVASSPDRTLLAVGTTVGVYIYNMATLKQIWGNAVHSPVFGIKWSPSGNAVATWLSPGNTIEVFDVKTGKQIAFIEHSLPLSDLAWSPDGGRMATAWGNYELRGGRISIWDVTSGKLLRTVGVEFQVDKPSMSPVFALAWSPDGNTIATAAEYRNPTNSGNGWERAWNIVLLSGTDGMLRTTLTVPKLSGCAIIQFLSFSPDSHKLAAFMGKTGGDAPCGDNHLLIWDITNPNPIPLFLASSIRPNDSVFAAEWSSDGSYIVSGGDSLESAGAVTIWDSGTGVALKVLDGQPATVYALGISPDGSIIASGAGDYDHGGSIVGWNAQTGVQEFNVTGLPYTITDISWLPSGDAFIAASIDGLLTFDRSGHIVGKGLATTYGFFGVTDVIWSPDGKHLATGIGGTSSHNRLIVWDMDSLIPIFGLEKAGYPVAWSPDGTLLVTGEGDSESNVQYHYYHYLGSSTGQDVVSPGWTYDKSTAWTGRYYNSPDGTMVVEIAGTFKYGTPNTRQIKIIDAKTQKTITELGGFPADIAALAWSPNRKYLAAGGGIPISLGSKLVEGWEENVIRIWDTSTWMLIHSYLGHTGIVNSLTWSPDSRFLASGSVDGTVIIWNVAP